MANFNTVISAAETKAQAEDTVQNPSTEVGGDASCGQNVFITLTFSGGQTIKAKDIYEMVDAKYGTVASIKRTVARNCFIFDIEA